VGVDLTAPPAGRGRRIRVGVVGANPDRGWGTAAHLPALACLPEFEIAAVATTRSETAAATAARFDVALAFDDPAELVVRDDVDLVAVTVKVPSHAAVIRAALAAGKHVLSEWPLGVDLGEAADLTELAHNAGVVHAVGLQGFYSAGAKFVAQLIADGRIGALRSVSLIAGSGMGGGRIPQQRIWATDPAAGVSALTITGGHVLATLTRTLGEPLRAVSTVVANLDPEATVVETGQRIADDTPDQVGVLGTLAGGTVVSVTIQGGIPRAAAGFHLRIVGNDGVLTITPGQGGESMHIAEWSIQLTPVDGEPQALEVPPSYADVPNEVPLGPPRNVAALYRDLAAAIAERRRPLASFDTAVGYHGLIATIQSASDTEARQTVVDPGSLAP
jgi:predicted dehydrogenase